MKIRILIALRYQFLTRDSDCQGRSRADEKAAEFRTFKIAGKTGHKDFPITLSHIFALTAWLSVPNIINSQKRKA